jgi:hypothetical protein
MIEIPGQQPPAFVHYSNVVRLAYAVAILDTSFQRLYS